MSEYSRTYEIRWADLDPNWHLRHSAYADYCTQARFSYLAENGFPAQRLAELGFGPVVFREETRYLKEVRMNDTIQVDFRVLHLGSRGDWRIRQHIRRADGQLAAIHELEGAWIDATTRKLTRPPQDLIDLLAGLHAQAEPAPAGEPG